MKKSTITGTTIVFTSHNNREDRLKRIIDTSMRDAINHANEGKSAVAEHICERINGCLAAAFYLDCIECDTIYYDKVKREIQYSIGQEYFGIKEI